MLFRSAVTEAPPVTDAYLIDKMCVIAMFQNVEPVIILTKSDIVRSTCLKETYEKCGFKVVECSAVTKEGCEEIISLAEGAVSVFTGNSGVGKSSILNALFPNMELETGEISEKIGRGKNTTRITELYLLDNNAVVADTPGFSSFDLTRMHKIDKDYLMHLFPEMENYWNECRFSGCTHRKDRKSVV